LLELQVNPEQQSPLVTQEPFSPVQASEGEKTMVVQRIPKEKEKRKNFRRVFMWKNAWNVDARLSEYNTSGFEGKGLQFFQAPAVL